MKPQTIYKLGNKLRIDLHTEPEFVFHIVVGEKNAAVLEPGKFYDFIRILNSITARQHSVLHTIGGKPVSVTGERILRKVPARSASQFDLFPDSFPEEIDEGETKELQENDKSLELYLRRRLRELKNKLLTERTKELMEEIEHVKELLKSNPETPEPEPPKVA